MNRFTRLSAAALVAGIPFFAFAQTPPSNAGSSVAPATSVQAPDAPRSQLEKDKTQQTGQATQYGQPGSGTSDQKSVNSGSTKSKRPKATTAVPTGSGTGQPTNTVDPTKTN